MQMENDLLIMSAFLQCTLSHCSPKIAAFFVKINLQGKLY